MAMDYLTRFTETNVLPESSAAGVRKFFVENILLRHGASGVLITDRGMAFTAQLTGPIQSYSETSQRRTTSYLPQTKGLMEHLNKTFTAMSLMPVVVEYNTWDAVLPYLTFTYKMAVRKTTQMTPLKLVYGTSSTTTVDAKLPHISNVENLDVAA
ncbi:uncharacterized protein [Dermacentor albipictus]|uniref:uncharacterized protein n=1 Tax=Dermacentor albipictus TaxID=60249 RepID=UPI0038FCB908